MARAGRTLYHVNGSLVFRIEGLAGNPGKTRDFAGARRVNLHVLDSVVDDELAVWGTLVGTVDGVEADFRVTAPVELTCTRCLTTWTEVIEATASQHFSKDPDEDGYAIVDGVADLTGPVTDELALAIPLAPVCRAGCKGLCPICGNDLNTDPCDGHGDDSDSPFASLKDLFDP